MNVGYESSPQLYSISALSRKITKIYSYRPFNFGHFAPYVLVFFKLLNQNGISYCINLDKFLHLHNYKRK